MQIDMRPGSARPDFVHKCGEHMKNQFKKRLLTVALLITSCTPAAVLADSAAATGGGNLSAEAHLNLRVTIPRFLFFRVGSVAAVDTIIFAPTDAELGDGNPIAGTGGDAAGGSGANVSVRSNGGQITLSENNDGGAGGLGAGAGNISLTQISVASDNNALPSPALSNAGGNTTSPTLNGGNVTNRTAIWTYSYDNTATPADGTYEADILYTAANF
jgi:hypothetical protein